MTIDLSILEAVALSRTISEYIQTTTDADRRQIVYAIRSRMLEKISKETMGIMDCPGLGTVQKQIMP